jgi:hypothetical protein
VKNDDAEEFTTLDESILELKFIKTWFRSLRSRLLSFPGGDLLPTAYPTGRSLNCKALDSLWLTPVITNSLLCSDLPLCLLGLAAISDARILNVARIVPDLDHSERLSAKHLAEPMQYRRLDRN